MRANKAARRGNSAGGTVTIRGGVGPWPTPAHFPCRQGKNAFQRTKNNPRDVDILTYISSLATIWGCRLTAESRRVLAPQTGVGSGIWHSGRTLLYTHGITILELILWHAYIILALVQPPQGIGIGVRQRERVIGPRPPIGIAQRWLPTPCVNRHRQHRGARRYRQKGVWPLSCISTLAGSALRGTSRPMPRQERSGSDVDHHRFADPGWGALQVAICAGGRRLAARHRARSVCARVCDRAQILQRRIPEADHDDRGADRFLRRRARHRRGRRSEEGRAGRRQSA